jgi:hypothetical protein
VRRSTGFRVKKGFRMLEGRLGFAYGEKTMDFCVFLENMGFRSGSEGGMRLFRVDRGNESVNFWL